jgi:hypothetical protein
VEPRRRGNLLNATSAATSAALIKPALNQPRSLGNADATPCVVDVRRLTLEAGDRQKLGLY